jgi:uncharacterized protein
MKSRAHDPLRLDVAAFAAEGALLEGRWPGDQLPRLAASTTPPQDTAPADVAWRVEGRQVPVAGATPEIWLHLTARATVWLTCQRCLRPFESSIDIDRPLRFVRGEAQAEALDAELEEDVLALPRSLDLREAVEDELLLALPLVPRHETCPTPLDYSTEPAGEAVHVERENPFAALQALKTRRED